MDRPLLFAALRILMNLGHGEQVTAKDLDLLRANALSVERDLDLDDLARSVAQRLLKEPVQG